MMRWAGGLIIRRQRMMAKIFADNRDFRQRRDFRRRPRFSPTPQILADGRARFKPSSRGVWGAAAPQENVRTQLTEPPKTKRLVDGRAGAHRPNAIDERTSKKPFHHLTFLDFNSENCRYSCEFFLKTLFVKPSGAENFFI